MLFLTLLLVGGAALVALVPLSGGQNETDAIVRSFTFTSDPETAVLTITHIGGLSGDRTVYTLHGDGRLRQELRARTGEVNQVMEASLTYEETRDFLEVAVSHGLLDTSPEELLAEIKHPPAMRDAGIMVVEIHVASYTKNGEEQGAVSNTLRLAAPRAQRTGNPESKTIAGMAALSEHLSRYTDRLGRPRAGATAVGGGRRWAGVPLLP